ncbi:phosphatidylserine decarboxylase proenzyme, mitochondrial isoform X2 [Anabrus simplex]|uniref:phosphatidylserine decarboxylase proenzyme, mitochondrial isoform X2 n=1 Tax=Anabrus simplex TaxID=316456 RepID=UPI0034DD488D
MAEESLIVEMLLEYNYDGSGKDQGYEHNYADFKSSEVSGVNKTQYGRSYLRWFWWSLPLATLTAAAAVVQWNRLMKKSREGTLEEAKDWEVTCYRSVPLRVFSRGWGWVSSRELPVKLRPLLYSKYISLFNVNLEEAASDDLTSYPTLGDFFCRPLKDGVRPIDCTDCVVSPADGRVLSVGKVQSDKVEQVKGVTYSLKTFLGECTWKQSTDHVPNDTSVKDDYLHTVLENKENALYQCVVYLAPGDYHRFHSPVDWTVFFRRHFQGELLSVNPTIAQWIPDLFALNERAVYVGHWKHGFFAYAAVGATNVGSIHVYFDKSLKTNQRKWHRGEPRHKDLYIPDGINISKGQPFGEFRLGSTIVILFEAPQDFNFRLKPGDKILVGEALSHCVR